MLSLPRLERELNKEIIQSVYVHTLRSSLENHTRFQIKMGKVYTRFQSKTAQKPNPMGWHIPIWFIKGSTPFPPYPPPELRTPFQDS